MTYLCFFYVLHLRFIYDLRFLWFCTYVFFNGLFMVFYFFWFCARCFYVFLFLRFSLPGPILGLENHGFAKEILGKSLKIHELPRKA